MLIVRNRIQWRAFIVIFVVTFFVLYCATGFNIAGGMLAETISTSKKTVLVLYGERLSIPAMKTTDQGLMAALSSGQPEVEIFSEYLDLARFPGAQYRDDVVRYLRARYAARKPDIVIAVASSALELVLAHRDELFPGIPIVFSNVDHREVEGRALPPNVTGLWMAWDYERTVELALQLQPATREMVCVSGTGTEEQAWNNEARKVLGRFATRVHARWLDKLPLQAVLGEVAQLPLDSVVLYISMLHDGEGKSVSPFEVARQLAEASRVPVYGLSLPQLQQGIIGGALLDFSEIGHKTAALAFRVLAGERPPVLSPPDPATNPLFINWRTLKKWHVSESRIPGEATVRYRDPSLWEQHPRLILATAAVVGLQSVLIVGLILQRSRLKRTEGSLRESEGRMGLAAEAANLGMWVWDVVKDELWMTDKGRALFGLAPDTRLDYKTVLACVHPADRVPRDEAIRRALETQGEYVMEYRVLLPDGKLRWISARARCITAGDTEGIRLLGVSMDVTRLKQAEAETRRQTQELTHLNRVAIMGEMAGSLAHELNQPLTGIINNAGAGRRFIAKGHPDLAKLDYLLGAIGADGRRAGEIIRSIRGMVRKGEQVLDPVNLNDVIASVQRLARSDALGRYCALVTELDPKLPLVKANQVQLQQVLLNLVVNAFDAMRETPAPERRIIIRSERESNGRVRVSVRDFGSGLPAEEPDRIFERFFSTKLEGMGMGLAIARSIITSHGGEMEAADAQGGGACVRFSLPVIAEGQEGSRDSRQPEGGRES